jgi:hypothetical protein
LIVEDHNPLVFEPISYFSHTFAVRFIHTHLELNANLLASFTVEVSPDFHVILFYALELFSVNSYLI